MTLDRRRLLLLASLAAAGLPFVRAARANTAATAEVTIDNFAFAPTPLSIAAGTTVTWTNRDDIPHSIVCPALQLHSHALDTNESAAAKFEKPGSYAYSCGLHPHMQGSVVVS